jgi:hypothetical protein
LQQLSRTASYKSRIESIKDLESLLVQGNEEEQNRFIQYRNRFFNSGEIVALTTEILIKAATYENDYDLPPQDALVYASVIAHLQNSQPLQSCFLNRNSKDFNIPDIKEELNILNCKPIFQFDQGYSFLRSQL